MGRFSVKVDNAIDNSRHYVTIKNMSRSVFINKIEKLLEEHCICKPDVTWQSRSNQYVVYEYEPFCAEGFDICIQCTVRTSQEARFIEYIVCKAEKEFTEQNIKIDFLEKCLEEEINEPALV